MSDDQELEDLNPQATQGTPVTGEPEGNSPLADAQSSLDEVMESLDHELPQPNLESEHRDVEPTDNSQQFDSAQVVVDDGGEDFNSEDPFVPAEEVPGLAQHDQELATELESLETNIPTQAGNPQSAQQQPQRGFVFPGLPPIGAEANPQALPDDGFFTQRMEQEGAGRDAQSYMFRAEQRHHGLMNEAMIEYARELELMSTRYERDRL